jgi:type II toxin-antitoxin system toxin YafQ
VSSRPHQDFTDELVGLDVITGTCRRDARVQRLVETRALLGIEVLLDDRQLYLGALWQFGGLVETSRPPLTCASSALMLRYLAVSRGATLPLQVCGRPLLPPASTVRFGVRGRARHRRQPDALLAGVRSRLAADVPLPTANRDHPLAGDWHGYRDCHLKPDLLLI